MEEDTALSWGNIQAVHKGQNMPRTRALYAYQWSCQGHVQAVVAFLFLKVSALVGTPGDGPSGTVAVGLRRAAVVSLCLGPNPSWAGVLHQTCSVQVKCRHQVYT